MQRCFQSKYLGSNSAEGLHFSAFHLFTCYLPAPQMRTVLPNHTPHHSYRLPPTISPSTPLTLTLHTFTLHTPHPHPPHPHPVTCLSTCMFICLFTCYLPAPQTRTVLPRPTPARWQAWTHTLSGSRRAPSS